MKEVIRTNDAVLLSFIEVLLREAGIPAVIADQNMSVLEGSIGVLPRRVLVADEDVAAAKSLLGDIERWRAEDAPEDDATDEEE